MAKITKDAQHQTNEYFDTPAKLVSVDEAEKLTNISAWTWRQYCREGRIASVKVGIGTNSKSQRLLIPTKEIRRFLAAGYRPRVDAREKARA
jgi:hypothetical protein